MIDERVFLDVGQIAGLIIDTRHWRGSATDVWFSIALPSGSRLDLGSTTYVDEFFRQGIGDVVRARKLAIAAQLIELGVKIEHY